MNNGLQRSRQRSRSESDLLAIPDPTGRVEFFHGLGRVPLVDAVLVCMVSEHAYTPGDEVQIDVGIQRSTSNPNQPYLNVIRTASSVRVNRNAGSGQIWNETASSFGTITESSWRIKIRCS